MIKKYIRWNLYNPVTKKYYRKFTDFIYYFSCRNLNKSSKEYQPYPKATKIDAIVQKICVGHNPSAYKFNLPLELYCSIFCLWKLVSYFYLQ